MCYFIIIIIILNWRILVVSGSQFLGYFANIPFLCDWSCHVTEPLDTQKKFFLIETWIPDFSIVSTQNIFEVMFQFLSVLNHSKLHLVKSEELV